MEIINSWYNEIAVAVLTAVSLFIYKNYLYPFFLGIIQSAPNLRGNWMGYDIDKNGKEIRTSMMEIKQIGTKIHALVNRQSDKGDRTFKYKGTVSSGQVVLIWKESKSHGYNMGTMTLLLSGDLKSLKGKTTYNHHDLGKIISQDKIYKKEGH
jgi:hypothetical protein